MNKKEQIKAAAECFKADKEGKYDAFSVCSDGQCFPDEHYAEQHQKELDKTQKPLKVLREDIAADEKKAPSAKEVIALIDAAKTVEAVEEIAENDSRATVKEAVAAKLEELNGKAE